MIDPAVEDLKETLQAEEPEILYFDALKTFIHLPGATKPIPDQRPEVLTHNINQNLGDGTRLLLIADDHHQHHVTYCHILDPGLAGTVRCYSSAIQIRGDFSYNLLDQRGFGSSQVRTCKTIVIMPISGGQFKSSAEFWRSRACVVLNAFGVLNLQQILDVLHHAENGVGCLEIHTALGTWVFDVVTYRLVTWGARYKDWANLQRIRFERDPPGYVFHILGTCLKFAGRTTGKLLMAVGGLCFRFIARLLGIDKWIPRSKQETEEEVDDPESGAGQRPRSPIPYRKTGI